jgi:hypothetical protein
MADLKPILGGPALRLVLDVHDEWEGNNDFKQES